MRSRPSPGERDIIMALYELTSESEKTYELADKIHDALNVHPVIRKEKKGHSIAIPGDSLSRQQLEKLFDLGISDIRVRDSRFSVFVPN